MLISLADFQKIREDLSVNLTVIDKLQYSLERVVDSHRSMSSYPIETFKESLEQLAQARNFSENFKQIKQEFTTFQNKITKSNSHSNPYNVSYFDYDNYMLQKKDFDFIRTNIRESITLINAAKNLKLLTFPFGIDRAEKFLENLQQYENEIDFLLENNEIKKEISEPKETNNVEEKYADFRVSADALKNAGKFAENNINNPTPETKLEENSAAPSNR